MMFMEENSAFNESKVVKAPGPATRGNTRGTNVASLIGPLFLNISMSRIISSETKKIMRPPAAANAAMLTLNNLSNKSPARKNSNIRVKDITVAFSEFTGRSRCFKLMMMGTEPIMSIIAKSTINVLKNSCKLNSLNIAVYIFCKNTEFDFFLQEKTYHS